jgi:predicted RNA binding protein YcfA (HicA-like mRNA interferase family)
MRNTFYKPLVRAIKAAGFELIRTNSGHAIYRSADAGTVITVPCKLDNHRLAKDIAKRAGAKLVT